MGGYLFKNIYVYLPHVGSGDTTANKTKSLLVEEVGSSN